MIFSTISIIISELCGLVTKRMSLKLFAELSQRFDHISQLVEVDQSGKAAKFQNLTAFNGSCHPNFREKSDIELNLILSLVGMIKSFECLREGRQK